MLSKVLTVGKVDSRDLRSPTRLCAANFASGIRLLLQNIKKRKLIFLSNYRIFTQLIGVWSLIKMKACFTFMRKNYRLINSVNVHVCSIFNIRQTWARVWHHKILHQGVDKYFWRNFPPHQFGKIVATTLQNILRRWNNIMKLFISQ